MPPPRSVTACVSLYSKMHPAKTPPTYFRCSTLPRVQAAQAIRWRYRGHTAHSTAATARHAQLQCAPHNARGQKRPWPCGLHTAPQPRQPGPCAPLHTSAHVQALAGLHTELLSLIFSATPLKLFTLLPVVPPALHLALLRRHLRTVHDSLDISEQLHDPGAPAATDPRRATAIPGL